MAPISARFIRRECGLGRGLLLGRRRDRLVAIVAKGLISIIREGIGRYIQGETAADVSGRRGADQKERRTTGGERRVICEVGQHDAGSNGCDGLAPGRQHAD